MKFFEEILKNRFKEATSKEGVDANELWANIENTLPPTPDKPSPKNGFKRFLPFLLVLVFLSLTLGWYFSTTTQATHLSAKEKTNTILNADLKQSTITKNQNQNQKTNSSLLEQVEPTVIIESNKNKEKEITSSEAIIKKVRLAKEQNQNETISLSKTAQQQQQQQSTTPNPILADLTTATAEKKENNTGAKITNPQEHDDDQFKRLPEESKKEIKNSILVAPNPSPLSYKVLDHLSNKTTSVYYEKEDQWANKINPIKPLQQQRFHFGISSGVNTWVDHFKESTNDKNIDQLLKKAYTAKPGRSIAFEAHWNFYKNFHIASGFEWTMMQQRFNFVQTWDTVMYKNNIPGSDLIDAIAIRTVQHTNKHHYYSLPIAIGISKSYGVFEMGISTGVAFNYFTKQNGKSLNADTQISTYTTKEETALPYANFFVSYQVRPFINYRSTKNISIQLRPDFRYQSHGQSAFFGLSHSSLLMGMNVGLLYSY